MANTTMDVLIAELLGDVGKLHDGVKSLQDMLPTLADDTEKRLAVVIGGLLNATEGLKKQADATIAATGEKLANKHKEEAARLVQHYVDAVGSAARDAARSAVQGELGQGVQSLNIAAEKANAAAGMMRSATISSLRGYGFAVFGIALFGALVGVGGTFGALRYLSPTTLLTEKDAKVYMNGQAINAAWPHLDASTQQRVTEALRQATTTP